MRTYSKKLTIRIIMLNILLPFILLQLPTPLPRSLFNRISNTPHPNHPYLLPHTTRLSMAKAKLSGQVHHTRYRPQPQLTRYTPIIRCGRVKPSARERECLGEETKRWGQEHMECGFCQYSPGKYGHDPCTRFVFTSNIFMEQQAYGTYQR